MRYLIDTCVLSELAKAHPEKSVVQWIEQCDEEHLFISVLTIGEIQKGITKVHDPIRKNALQQWLDSEVHSRFETRILPITEEIAQAWGTIQAETEMQGKPLPSIDGLIAATALANNLTVVTRNEKDIARSGVRIINPWIN